MNIQILVVMSNLILINLSCINFLGRQLNINLIRLRLGNHSAHIQSGINKNSNNNENKNNYKKRATNIVLNELKNTSNNSYINNINSNIITDIMNFFLNLSFTNCNELQ